MLSKVEVSDREKQIIRVAILNILAALLNAIIHSKRGMVSNPIDDEAQTIWVVMKSILKRELSAEGRTNLQEE